MNEIQTWPLWRCLKPQAIVFLIDLQWRLYKTHLDFMADMYAELESLAEIDWLMRQRPKGKLWRG